MSPRPSSCSAPLPSSTVRESTLEATWNAMRVGKLALINPVTTSTDGRCVATIRWMPTARAIWASRTSEFWTSPAETIMRSASSSTTTTQYGSRSSAIDRPVVALDVAHLLGLQRLVALVHLADDPAQAGRRLLGVGHHRGQQVRDALVDGQLQTLGIDHQEAHVGRRGLVEDRADHRVEADRLAAARGAGDEQVRHGRQIGDHRLPRARPCRGPAAACPWTRRTPPRRRSRAGTRWTASSFGTSMATVPRPGIGPTMRTEAALRASARSSARFTTWLTFTPAAGSNSYEVMIGPGLTCTMRPSTSKSCSFLRRVSALSCSSSRVRRSSSIGGGFSRPTGGSWNDCAPPLAEVERLLPGQALLHQPAARQRVGSTTMRQGAARPRRPARPRSPAPRRRARSTRRRGPGHALLAQPGQARRGESDDGQVRRLGDQEHADRDRRQQQQPCADLAERARQATGQRPADPATGRQDPAACHALGDECLRRLLHQARRGEHQHGEAGQRHPAAGQARPHERRQPPGGQQQREAGSRRSRASGTGPSPARRRPDRHWSPARSGAARDRRPPARRAAKPATAIATMPLRLAQPPAVVARTARPARTRGRGSGGDRLVDVGGYGRGHQTSRIIGQHDGLALEALVDELADGGAHADADRLAIARRRPARARRARSSRRSAARRAGSRSP